MIIRGVLFGLLVFVAPSTADDADRFEVASIQPSAVKGGRPSFEPGVGGSIRATNVTLKLLIEMAYDIRPEQLAGGPGWTDSEEYTVAAKGPEGEPVLPEREGMERMRARLQALLQERFHLAMKVEKIPAAGYALTVDKKGYKMTPASGAVARQLRQTGRWGLHAEGIEMPTLARFLGVHLHATVVDQTGLEGRFSFQLNWDPRADAPIAFDQPEESLIPAVQEQLGLRLEQQKVPTDQYTIEHAERPAEK